MSMSPDGEGGEKDGGERDGSVEGQETEKADGGGGEGEENADGKIRNAQFAEGRTEGAVSAFREECEEEWGGGEGCAEEEPEGVGRDVVGAHDFPEEGECGEGGVEAIEVKLEEALTECLTERAECQGEGQENGGEGEEDAAGKSEE
jgi:hypothetical protein